METRVELESKRAALRTRGESTRAVNVAINHCREIPELKTKIASRHSRGLPAADLEAELFSKQMCETGY